jgi:UDP-N-acetylglucosamine/UDP-N-acetylgalactosamine diphosphorylase
MSSKMVAKASPEEKVGVFCASKGKIWVIEYSDLPEALARAQDANGRLEYLAGSIAIHLMSVDFVEKLTAEAHHFALPYHRAVKAVPHVNLETGEPVVPDVPNAVKLETFVFDALPLADSSIVLETSRVEEFAPIKNARGPDSPATSHAIQSDRAGRWLASHGVAVPFTEDGHVAARIEISPLTALEASDLAAADLPAAIGVGEDVVL